MKPNNISKRQAREAAKEGSEYLRKSSEKYEASKRFPNNFKRINSV